jgi:hypothetical protein
MWFAGPQSCVLLWRPDAVDHCRLFDLATVRNRPLPAHLPTTKATPAPHQHGHTHQPHSARPYLSVVPLPSPRTIQIQHTTAVRRGAIWTADHHLQLTVAAVAGSVLVVLVAELSWLVGRPDGGCPAQRPAGIQRSGVVAVVGKARTPATASVAGPRPPCGVHSAVPPSCPAVQRPAPIWCPACPVSSPSGVGPSGVHPSGGQPAAVRPVRPDASVSSHLGRWRSGPGRGGEATVTTGTGRGPCGCRAVGRLGRQPSRPGGVRRCRGRGGQ